MSDANRHIRRAREAIKRNREAMPATNPAAFIERKLPEGNEVVDLSQVKQGDIIREVEHGQRGPWQEVQTDATRKASTSRPGRFYWDVQVKPWKGTAAEAGTVPGTGASTEGEQQHDAD
ncbi:hypothetical protein [Ferrovibrio terrae]|uniref:hypothetical protein n=1 Tax=Ferrovibrio terrae TaxID=2594003 RepID=UPI0031383303